GLDTIADIELNGVPVGSARNMHRRYRFDLAGALRPGENRITVHFSAPYGYAEHWRAELGDRPAAYAEPYPFIRKMACNFGWDWGPTLVTSGIWRPIGLEAWSVARLARVRPFADAAGNLRVHVDVEREPGRDGPLEVTAAVAGAAAAATLAPGESAAVVELRVPGARPWWPRGHGEQPLYELTVALRDPAAAGPDLDAWRGRIGF